MDPVRPAPFVATLTAVAAGGVHLAVAAPHLEESVVLGVAFIVTAWLQILLGALLWRRRSQRVRFALGAVQAAAIGAWAISSTVGLPVGHGGPEPLGIAGVVTVVLELSGIVALLVWMRPDRGRRLQVGAASLAVGLVVAGASVAVADGAQGHAHGDAHGLAGEKPTAPGPVASEPEGEEPMAQEPAAPEPHVPADVTGSHAPPDDGVEQVPAPPREEATPHSHDGTEEHEH